jgi:DNA polymerase III epsilon subunit-like protein
MILFFDTETNGLPKNYKGSPSDTSNWPRICQLAWIVCENDGSGAVAKSLLIKPDGTFTISAEAQKVHGHTLEKLEREGLNLADVIAEISADIVRADLIVAHNLAFDYPVLACEFIRCGSPKRRGNYKWPTIQKLHNVLFGHEFEGAHDALADIKAIYKCYFELINRKIINARI